MVMSALCVFDTGIQNSLDEWNRFHRIRCSLFRCLFPLWLMLNAKKVNLILIYAGGYPVLLYFNVMWNRNALAGNSQKHHHQRDFKILRNNLHKIIHQNGIRM